MEKNVSPKKTDFFALTIFAGLLLLFYRHYLLHPGTLYARVVRDFWPIYHTWPYFELSKRIFAEGHFPLWNPFNACGTPILGNFQAAPFHPVRMLLFLFPFWSVIDIWLILRVFLSGAGTYLFLRRRAVGRQGAVLAGCAWMFSGSVTDYINMHYLDIDLLLPFGLLAFDWMVRSRKIAPVITSAAIIFLAFLGGNPTSALYFLIFVSSYYFYRAAISRENLRMTLMRFVVAGCLSGLVSAIILLPFREMLSLSWDYHPKGFWNVALDPHYALSVLSPLWFSFIDSTVMPLIQNLPFIGTVVVVIASFAFFNLNRTKRDATFFAGIVIISVGLIWSIKPFFILSHFPLLNRTANFRYIYPETTYCVALLAGMGWDILASSKKRAWYLIITPIALSVISVVIILAQKMGVYAFSIAANFFMILSFLAWTTAFIALFQRGTLTKNLALIAIILLWFFEVWIHFVIPSLDPNDLKNPWKISPMSSNKLLGNRKIYGIYSLLYQNLDFLRGYEDIRSLLYPNLNLAFGHEDLRYFDALYIARYRNFMSILNNQTPAEAFEEFIPYNFISVRQKQIESPLMDLAGVGIVLSRDRLLPNLFIDQLLKNSNIEAPDCCHVTQKRMEVGNVLRNTLYQHPPSKITSAVPKSDLSFGVGIDQKMWSTSGDGVTFLMLENQAGKQKVIFARHIDGAHNMSERRWLDYSLTFGGEDISLITLPGDNFENDWAGWGELRSSAVDGETGYKLLQDEKMYIYQNPLAMPRAFSVKKAIVAPAAQCENMLTSMDFRATACIEESSAQKVRGNFDSADAKVDWRRVASDKSEIDVDSSGEAMVVVTETYYPGWRAIMENGVELKIRPADVMFRAVETPPGKHKVTFIYKPASFKIGLWASLVSIIMMAFLIRAGSKPASAGKQSAIS